jgi:transposase InsO family protein
MNREDRTLKRDQIREQVIKSFKQNKCIYGSPRLVFELQEQGYEVSRSTVARVMKTERLIARPRRKYVHTTDSDHNWQVVDNILDRQFSATRPNEKWVSDISYILTKEGWTYLTVIIDLFDRMVVGWTLSPDMSTENTTIKSLKIAMERRTINQALLFHSDRGVQYCSSSFRDILAINPKVNQSMSRRGNCWDNAVAESFFKTLKTEWVSKCKYQNLEDAQRSIFDYIERLYNTKRRHSANNYMSPLQKYYLFFNRNAA